VTAATVLIPTWDSPGTLGPAVRSALRQEVSDIEILVVGDGVTDRNREVIRELLDEDPRVRFLDLPKGMNRGERNRDAGVKDATSDVIVYLADDDLLMPRHVGNLLGLLERVPFAQSQNGYIARDESLRLWPTDLSRRGLVDWHLLNPPRNRVSITGTAHTRPLYLRLKHGWDVAPPGTWTDLFLWRQFFRLPDFTAATHPEVTTLQFPAATRTGMSPESVGRRYAEWERFTREPDAHARLQVMAKEAAATLLADLSARVTDLEIERDELRRAERELHAIRASRSWRMTSPFRAIGRAVRGGNAR
jgi:glycosyltransferase involved in cell wall biosynthesis